jgi:glycosyltransferase involved in cell wall biosynthesis
MTLRLLYLSPVGELGGAERCLLTMIRAVRETDPGIEPHLLACAEGPLLAEARRAGAQTHCLSLPPILAQMGTAGLLRSNPLQALAAWPEARDYVRQYRSAIERIAPDLIHSNGIKTHLLSGWLGRIEPPVLWHIHDFLGHRALVPRLLRPASADIAGAIAISRAVAGDTRRVLPGLPVDVILNAVDINHFTPHSSPSSGTPQESREAGSLLDVLANLPPTGAATLRVGLVAAYARWKGQDIFLAAAARLLQRRPAAHVRFYIIGGRIYRTKHSQFSKEELQATAAALHIGPHVGFIDFQKDPAPIYRALDVVVHASTQPEPFGLTIAEAMACSRPVIVSQAGGAAELFTGDVDGLGVPPGDDAALAAAMARLLDDPALCRSLGARARQTAEARFNPTRLGRQLCDLYRRHARR